MVIQNQLGQWFNAKAYGSNAVRAYSVRYYQDHPQPSQKMLRGSRAVPTNDDEVARAMIKVLGASNHVLRDYMMLGQEKGFAGYKSWSLTLVSYLGSDYLGLLS